MICDHPECNGRHSAADGYANLCPAARAKRLSYYRRWSKGQSKASETLSKSLEVSRPDSCIWLGCGKPIEARNMCAMHRMRARRAGDLAPYERPPRALCIDCRRKPSKPGCGERCKACDSRRWRKVTPGREAYMARERERKRKTKKSWPSSNKSQLATVVRDATSNQQEEQNQCQYA